MSNDVLILGGNGFIGAHVVRTLLANGITGTSIHIVNRGRSKDWASDVLCEQVSMFKYDRRKPVSSCPALVSMLNTHQQTPGGTIKTVVDLSAYDDKPMRNIMPHLTCKPSLDSCSTVKRPLYIYISSDSVYDVSVEKQHGGPSKETDAVRPASEQQRKKLAEDDEYGDEKLKGEEYLQEQQQNRGLDFVVLRLADVIGPGDTTDRWWHCQLYLHVATALREPVFIPKELVDKQLSFVYVKDIAMLIFKLVSMTDVELVPIVNEAYNLACSETISMQGTFEAIQSHLYRGETTFRYTKNSECVPQLYPSVERGPICTDKASLKLGWSNITTPLHQAMQQTMQFYEEIMIGDQYKMEKKDIYDSMMEDFGSLYDHRKLKKILKSVLHIDNDKHDS